LSNHVFEDLRRTKAPNKVVTFVLLLNWVGIYLYLVIANKILTNFKSNAQLQPSSLVSLTLHVSSQLWRVHTHYSPQLVER
jgi:high-affinity K+ transport system ATPase subunit B